jgi:hypothetical protein
MKSFTTLALSLLAAASSVSAHGFISGVTANGKTYKGNVPNNAKFDSPIRLINDISPVKGANNPNIVCGQNAKAAKLTAPVDPGSTVEFDWFAGGGKDWPHNTGPIINYMAKCDGNCASFNPANAKWFKVSQDGRKSDGSWVQADLMAGKTVSMTIPKNLASGQYLIRHEIIALHLATEINGAEFYPGCVQVEVTGNGNGVPDKTVRFPGAYSDSDPGIFDRNVFSAKSKYEFPGGPIAKIVGGGNVADPEQPTASPTAAPTGDDDEDNTAMPTATPTGGDDEDNTAEPTPAPSTSTEPAQPSSTKSCKSHGGEYKRMMKAKRHVMHSSH